MLIKGLKAIGSLPLWVWPFVWSLCAYISGRNTGVAMVVFVASYGMWALTKVRG